MPEIGAFNLTRAQPGDVNTVIDSRIQTPDFDRAWAACDAHGSLLIFDEIPTGLGKTGALFTHQPFGAVPDLVFRGNVVRNNKYGILGAGAAPGQATIEQYLPGLVFAGNVIAGNGQNGVQITDVRAQGNRIWGNFVGVDVTGSNALGNLLSNPVGTLGAGLTLPFLRVREMHLSKAKNQAAYESANTLWPTLLSGVNFCLHAAGWLEGGLSSGYEKLIMDADQLTMFQKLAEGLDFSENGQAMDAIREVGPGSHYLGCAHTQANFETAFWRSGLADNNSFEQWRDDGEKDIVARANATWKKMLRDYDAPPLDPAIDESLLAFMAKRKESLPDTVS